ncbi:MAG: hypothetical protein MUF34_12155 [Polyangiaceae bacterium]|jgi:hypothetical protein|nr:hypothetical protein [Polyangiaceae bacterium]
MTRRLSYALAAPLLVALNACMLSPNDGTVMNSTEVVPFSGYTGNPNEPVQVEAFDGVAWAPLATTASETTPFRYDDTDLYEWGVNVAIPANRWRPGTTGFAAQVRARVGTSLEYTATTFTPNWVSCRNQNPLIADFLSRCKSPRAPNAFLYTPDYPANVDLVLANIAVGSSAGINVSVRNGGRPGRITRLECFRLGGGAALTPDRIINPLETVVINVVSISSAPGGTVTCNVIGANENGSAETNTANNTRSQVF